VDSLLPIWRMGTILLLAAANINSNYSHDTIYDLHSSSLDLDMM
jgi:hypothetical protein